MVGGAVEMNFYSEPDLDHEVFHKAHKGTGVLVATGPSLTDVPLDRLSEVYPTMSLNRITLKVPLFVPDYYLCIGLTHFDTQEKRDTMKPLISHPDCKAAFIQRMWAWEYPWRKVIPTMGTHPMYGQPIGSPAFSLDPRMCVGTTTNSAYPCLQVMYWLGFTTVIIVGLDHRYPEGTRQHFYDNEDAPGFDAGPGKYTEEQWELIGNKGLSIADKVYRETGRRILNLTEGSHCTAFEFDRMENWI
jgi:hypothetical protein